MLTKPLEIKKYLSEELELLSELLNKGEDTLLVSPTDSGKTRAIISYAKQNPQRRIAILCPTQALVDNSKARLRYTCRVWQEVGSSSTVL